MSTELKSVEELTPAVVKHLTSLGNNIRRGMLETFWLAVTGQRSPKGSLRNGDPHPGKFRASHRASVGEALYAGLPDQGSYPTLGIPDIQGVLSEVQLGSPIHVTNDAASDGAGMSYAPILELGRHVDSRGRLAGSEQAPAGVYGPAIEEVLLPSEQAIFDRALAQTMQETGE